MTSFYSGNIYWNSTIKQVFYIYFRDTKMNQLLKIQKSMNYKDYLIMRQFHKMPTII